MVGVLTDAHIESSSASQTSGAYSRESCIGAYLFYAVVAGIRFDSLLARCFHLVFWGCPGTLLCAGAFLCKMCMFAPTNQQHHVRTKK